MTVAAQAILGQAIYEYSKMVGNNNYKNMYYCSMISDKWIASSEEELYVGNRLASPLIKLSVEPDFEKCAK